jgi:glycosyltransferase involved in cell wall biosynthesis/GR25 family glycosyltransferase involved in LPS biosynthesis
MKKIIFITPHLSTGGLPQFLLKKIEVLIDTFDIYCIEWDNVTGGRLVVQRNQIENILKDKLITAPSDKSEVPGIIRKINPDIIHFEEFPETFVPYEIIQEIYQMDCKICETTHGTLFNSSEKISIPDKTLFVSNGNVLQYKKVSSDFELIEYPTKSKELRNHFINELGLDSKKFHVLNVGLFNSNKNQGEIFKYSEHFTNDVQFHFVGNQAINFESYWKPLMENKPENCVVWGERNDAFKFYALSDLFLFTSKLENKPLSIKEALNNNVPVVMYNLPNYGDDYINDDIKFLTNDFDTNLEILKGIIPERFHKEKKVKKVETKKISSYHILTDLDTEREIKSMESLTKLKEFGIDYTMCVNKRYTELPPSDTCQYPEKISLEPGGKLTPGHYGCYLGHKGAVFQGIESNSDFILIFECDCVIDVPYNEFIDKLNFACDLLNKTDLLMFSFGYHNNVHIIEKNPDYWVVNKFYGAHAYLIPKKSFQIIKDMYNNSKWNVTDLLYAEKLDQFKTGILETPITKQSAGISILDKIYNEDRH